MNRKGRPRKADSEHIKQGTYRKDRHQAHSMVPLPGTRIEQPPEPPEWLGEIGKAEWVRLVDLLDKANTLAKTDLAMLAMACNEFDCYVAASKQAAETGRFYTVMKDGSVSFRQVHPIHSVSQQHLKAYVALANEFGLSPASRAKVPHTPEKPQSKLQGMLKKAL